MSTTHGKNMCGCAGIYRRGVEYARASRQKD
jgi:hypothetical protein